MSPSLRAWRAAKAALLLSPALLAGCYVVPVVPGPYPVYRQYQPSPYYRQAPRYRGPYGEAAPAPQSFAAASAGDAATPAEGSFDAQLASASIER